MAYNDQNSVQTESTALNTTLEPTTPEEVTTTETTPTEVSTNPETVNATPQATNQAAETVVPQTVSASASHDEHEPERDGGELGDLLAERTGGEARIGREEAERVVTPVVDELAVREAPFVERVLYRQELDGRHGERPEMIDDRVRGEPEIRAAQMARHVRMRAREAADVALVNDGATPRHARRPIVTRVSASGSA